MLWEPLFVSLNNQMLSYQRIMVQTRKTLLFIQRKGNIKQADT